MIVLFCPVAVSKPVLKPSSNNLPRSAANWRCSSLDRSGSECCSSISSPLYVVSASILFRMQDCTHQGEKSERIKVDVAFHVRENSDFTDRHIANDALVWI